MKNKRNIKDYIHLYVGCEVEILSEEGKKINLGLYYPDVWTADGNLEPNGVNIFYPEIKKVYAMNFGQVKPFLHSLKSLTQEVFEEFATWLLHCEGETMKFATINDMWCACSVDLTDYADEDIRDKNDSEFIIEAEENDYNNVLSCTQSEKSLAYGSNDEMRFFIETEIVSAWINLLRKKFFDLDNLIKDELAIEIK